MVDTGEKTDMALGQAECKSKAFTVNYDMQGEYLQWQKLHKLHTRDIGSVIGTDRPSDPSYTCGWSEDPGTPCL